VAHDLQAPLRAIDGFSMALLEDYGEKLDDQGRLYLRHVHESALNMGALIKDLLELARVARSEFHRETVDLTDMVRRIFADLRLNHSDRHVDLVIADDLTAEGDERLLQVALTNLLGNAWKFTGKRETAHIEVGMLAGEPATYFVRDDGAGFDMQHADKLFGVFQRLHSTSAFEGTGIGLATVQRIVNRHGGRIWAEAEVDRGACFYFTLPTARK
jgi:light-regulated signal transduction histidine kinase (bacteriophytochrome)